MPSEIEDQARPRVVAFGGGTGMSALLSGLKHITPRLTAIVTVTDNGGSSGRLRKDFDMVPPGDIRNCLVALAEGEPLLARLLQYRFQESELEGHSLGNLFLLALTRVTGSFDRAVRELNRMLNVRGQVLPATGSKVSLIAIHPDGSKSTGEVEVSASGKPIERVEMRPRVGPAARDVVEAIAGADLLLFGPGSLFTSVIPNVLVPGIREAILANGCEKVYVANIMTQPGETTGIDALGHLEALEAHVGRKFVTGVVVHEGKISEAMVRRYAERGAMLVKGLNDLVAARPLKIVAEDLLDRRATVIRHEPTVLARCIASHFLSRIGRGLTHPTQT